MGAASPGAAEFGLALRVKVKAGEPWEIVFDPPLGLQIAAQVEDATATRAMYRPGRVFCFRCDLSTCEHAAPLSPLSVFAGYAPNGLPVWTEFAQALIEARDPRVDRLFEPGGAVLALVQFGRDLRQRQLGSFGRASKTYSILGQVIAGYFTPDGADPPQSGEPRRLAVTLQIVEGRGERGEMELHLNVLGGASDGKDLAERLAGGWQPGLRRARDTTAREVEEMEDRARGAHARGDIEGMEANLRRVPGVLRRLADSLERAARQGARRTHHAEHRRREQRPVHKALEDARNADPGMLYHDEKTDAIVVCAPQGRAHVFAGDGRHVTSFVLRPGSVEFRLRTERWRRVTPEEARAFQSRMGAAELHG
jgi:hypothetical protein